MKYQEYFDAIKGPTRDKIVAFLESPLAQAYYLGEPGSSRDPETFIVRQTVVIYNDYLDITFKGGPLPGATIDEYLECLRSKSHLPIPYWEIGLFAAPIDLSTLRESDEYNEDYDDQEEEDTYYYDAEPDDWRLGVEDWDDDEPEDEYDDLGYDEYDY